LPAGGATLSFVTSQDLEPNFDFGNVEITTDGINYVGVAKYTGMFHGTRSIDISQFAGQSIKVRFRFTSDLANDPPPPAGWFVEDIRISSDDFHTIGETFAGTTSFQVTGRANGTYLYRIAALFATTEGVAPGPYSNTRCVIELVCQTAPVITAPSSVPPGTTGIVASVPNHAGSTYNWTLTGGTITGGQGTSQITYNAGPPGTCMHLQVAETAGVCVSAVGAARTSVDFLDVPPSHPQHDFINILACSGISSGYGDGTFQPGTNVSREQMAIFVVRGLGFFNPPVPQQQRFTDVGPERAGYRFIDKLASLGITGGCTSTTFCPDDNVSRTQMAVFLVRAVHGSAFTPPAATCTNGHTTEFEDVPCPDFFANYIVQFFHDGITGGCSSNPPLFCPGSAVSRAQMAIFLVRAFHLQ